MIEGYMMTNRAFRFCVSGLFVAACSFAPVLARGEEPPPADVAAARALGQEGVKLADAGDCQEAIDKLQRSEKLFHAPTTLARLGECQIQVGRIVHGTESLNRVVREVLPANAPAAFVAAQERAKKLLADARPKIARLKIAVAAPPDAPMTVKVDGEVVPLANLNTNRPMDPGDHVVEVTAPGFKPVSGRVHLAEGGSDSLALTLEPDPNAPKPAPVAPAVVAPPPESPPSPAPSSSPSRGPAYVALGLGAVGVGVGTAFGLMAMSKRDDLEAACTNKQCSPDQRDTIDGAKTDGIISTVGFAVGGVGLAVGAFLYFSGRTNTRVSTTQAGLTLEPSLGLDRVGVRGSF